jgi:hypothetical protein
MFWLRTRPLPTVAFATSVWEKDWRPILLDPEYLPVKQIGNHCFPFSEKILVINNVLDEEAVQKAAAVWVSRGVLTRVVKAEERVLASFALTRSDFRVGADAVEYEGVNPDWIYYNALGPLTAIRECRSDYLLYLTGDVRMELPCDWVHPALALMEKEDQIKVANPLWNGRYEEAKRESSYKRGAFFVAKEGFSDQLFLVRRREFQQPIYGEIRADSAHYPRGDVFEKRVFSYMKNRGWERITYRRGSYTHENFSWAPSHETV